MCYSMTGEPQHHTLLCWGQLVAGTFWVLMVYGQVVERDVRGAWMSRRGSSPSRAGSGLWILFRITVGITAQRQVTRQADFQLEPQLSVLWMEKWISFILLPQQRQATTCLCN